MSSRKSYFENNFQNYKVTCFQMDILTCIKGRLYFSINKRSFVPSETVTTENIELSFIDMLIIYKILALQP